MLALLIGFFLTFRIVLAEQRIQGAGQARALQPAPPGLGDGLIVAKVRRVSARRTICRGSPPSGSPASCSSTLRGVASWMAARRLRRRGVCAAAESWQALLDRLAARLRLSRPVTLLESCLAEVPVVIGYVRPVILMPVGLLAGLPAGQIESILLHELAHIRRHDYLVNLLQIVVESLVFYHPAVWWISGVMRAERENCCDDLVVATQGDAFAYAAALTALEQNRGAVREAVLAATGGSLVKRVRRLLIQPEGPRAALTPVFSAAILTVTVAAALAAWQTTRRRRLPAGATAGPSAGTPVRTPEDTPYRSGSPRTSPTSSPMPSAPPSRTCSPIRSASTSSNSSGCAAIPLPAPPENEMKEEHYRRIAYANDHFAASDPRLEDRPRPHLHHLRSARREGVPSFGERDVHVPFEQWLYHFIEGVGTNVVIEFVDPNKTGEYRMTTDPAKTPP